MKTELKTPTGSFSIAIFAFGRWSKNNVFFLGHIAISQPMLEIMS